MLSDLRHGADGGANTGVDETGRARGDAIRMRELEYADRGAIKAGTIKNVGLSSRGHQG